LNNRPAADLMLELLDPSVRIKASSIPPMSKFALGVPPTCS